MKLPLELRGVSKDYSGLSGVHRAVDGVSLSIPPGMFFSLLGPSGCGKTTTLRLIGGFETLTSGEIWLNGVRIDKLPPYKRSVNTVFQNYALFPHLTVRGNIEFGLRQNGHVDLDGPVRKVLDQLQLAEKESRKPGELSGGERQRVALARALVLSPEVLLLDEPLAALDPQLRKQVRAELKDLQKRTGVTFLFVTHDQEEALSMSGRIALMNQGAIEQVGSPEELYQRPRTRFAATFLGAMNWWGGIGIRPEATRISCARVADAFVSHNACVTGITFLGPVIHVEVRTVDGTQLVAQCAPGEPLPRISEKVVVYWSPSDETRFTQ
jgi:ABC-type Fe3+/spermidine/putrescine transport system ATPase subunit